MSRPCGDKKAHYEHTLIMLPGQALIYLFQKIDTVDSNHLAQDLIHDLQDLKKPLISMKDLLTAVPNRKGRIFPDDERKLCRV